MQTVYLADIIICVWIIFSYCVLIAVSHITGCSIFYISTICHELIIFCILSILLYFHFFLNLIISFVPRRHEK